MTDTEMYHQRKADAEFLRERANRIQDKVRARYSRQDKRRDVDTLNKLVGEDPHAKAAIADQQFARAEAALYGPGAVIEKLDELLVALRVGRR